MSDGEIPTSTRVPDEARPDGGTSEFGPSSSATPAYPCSWCGASYTGPEAAAQCCVENRRFAPAIWLPRIRVGVILWLGQGLLGGVAAVAGAGRPAEYVAALGLGLAAVGYALMRSLEREREVIRDA